MGLPRLLAPILDLWLFFVNRFDVNSIRSRDLNIIRHYLTVLEVVNLRACCLP